MGTSRKIVKIPFVLARNGFLCCCHLTYICFVLPFIMKFLPIGLRLYPWIKRTIQKYFSADKKIQYWRQNKEKLLRNGETGYRTRVESLGLDWRKLQSLTKFNSQLYKVVIGEMDQDGFLLSKVGVIPNVPSISEKQFLARKRFGLRMVAINGYVCVEKHYKGDKLSFVNEIEALHNLGLAGCNVPAIMDVDFDNLTLTLSYILGFVLREELAKKGAFLRDRDVNSSSAFTSLDQKQKRLKRIQEGKRVLYEVIDSKFVESLFAELNKIHGFRFIWNDIKYGNIIIEKRSRKPYLVDFDWAGHYPRLGNNAFRILRDRDIEKFNLHFGTEKLTHKRMRQRIKHIKCNKIYAPVYFGSSLSFGNTWNTDVGYGRWHYILKHNLPVLSGKRILDLGCNNAFNSIQMLRSGAREVIGIELNSEVISQGNFVKAGFEWADNRQYRFKYLQANMKELPRMNLGNFDIVLALCSIYYLDDYSMANLVKYISTITNTFVLQCNTATNIDRSNQHTYEKASVEYILNVLRSNGFPVTQAVAPYKYSRPLVIGRKKE